MRIILVGSVRTVKRLRILLGTLVAVEAAADSEDIALTALEAAFEAIRGVQQRMHPGTPGSDLAAINAAPPGTPVEVHADTADLLRLAGQLHGLTDGVFDPCLPVRPGSLSDIDVRDAWVTCSRVVSLDFGGFAKGHAVDRAIEVLQAQGCRSGLVNAGGDIRVFGPRSEPILLRRADGNLLPTGLVEGALAVSDRDWMARPPEHQGFYRGRCAPEEISAAATPCPALPRHAAVLADRAVIADALTKCVLLCRPEVSERVLQRFQATRA